MNEKEAQFIRDWLEETPLRGLEMKAELEENPAELEKPKAE